MATLCERCIHSEICAVRDSHDDGDERAMTYCSNFADSKEAESLREELDAATISLHIAKNRIDTLENELTDYKMRYKGLLERYISMKEQKANEL